VLLLDLDWLLVFFVFHGFLELLSLHILIGLKISIEDHPLRSLVGESGNFWRIGLDTFVSDWKVESLG
jgi:hypothetical protein